ncbi:helix-turn-helix domain-containing protein [Bdellovibrio reynosensis]|uniref:Helix-turn-helix domain-containing protein n=1 Tax=Bdellovibrio reynosensis TaxID=2835041 RepID=A0ABY4CDL9_9BACT|nr:helix-turn-helix domain-containing protein [Bdellovibrio reynosensis]UOF02884.1 helix-turn-helix domain-containing protein [Bdellovibrio reynosensis]
MNNKSNNKKPSPQSILQAFESFAFEATEKELDEALTAAGEDPKSILKAADSAIARALAEAGRISSKTEPKIQNQKALHEGLRTIITLLRRKKGISQEELAALARINLSDVRNIETDDYFTPSPRTVYQLEQFFELEPRSLVLMSGTVSKHSSGFTDQIVKFAAHSKEIGKLSSEEKKLLNDFVKFLSNELKKRG